MKKILNRYIYSDNDELGRGAFGQVYKGTDTKTSKFVAIKFMKIDEWSSQITIDNFKKEMCIMKEFNHPNIVKVIDFQVNTTHNIVIFDYCEGGDLSKYLEKNGTMLDERTATSILIQVIYGFQEIINKGYIHRDVKPANILISNGIFKIADFGFATKATNSDIFDQQVGTPLYMAPQILENQKYSSKCDIWSIGIIAYEMIYGRQPWACRDMNSYLKNIKCLPLRFPIEKIISDQYKDFVRKCLRIQEYERANWQTLFQHPLLETRQLTHKTYNIIQIDEETKIILKNIQYITQLRQLQLEQQFQIYDKDKGGTLDMNEFAQFLSKLDPSLTFFEQQKIFQYLDQHKQEKINLEQFQQLFCANDFSDLKNKAERLISDIKQIIISNNIDLDKIFNHFDIDKEDDLKIDEFTNFLQIIAPLLKPKEISIIFAEFDKDHSNAITRLEFKNILFVKEQNYEKQKIQKLQSQLLTLIKQQKQSYETIFKIFNESKTNKLNYMEFSNLCKNYQKLMTDEEIKLIFQVLDRNKDKLINFDEFTQFFK